jgi:hypothetical protein
MVALCAVAGQAGAEALPSGQSFGAASCRADVGGGAGGRPASARIVTAAQRGVARPAAQVTRNEQADVTFELQPSADGVVLTARIGDLLVTKTVQSSGEFVLDIANDGDKVTIAASGQGTTVTRGKTNIAVPRGNESAGNADKIRRLLADSRAVLRFRGVSASLLEAEDRSPAALALIMADATVGMLTGDVGAPRRIAQFLARGARKNLRPVSMAVDCFTTMETRFVEAYGDYWNCYISVSPYTFYQDLCSWRWVLQVESYWFSFLSCSGFNW